MRHILVLSFLLIITSCSEDIRFSLDENSVLISHVSLSPKKKLPQSLSDPIETGWPELNENTTWTAYIVNKSSKTISVEYSWSLNNAMINNGMAELNPGYNYLKLEYLWTDVNDLIKLRLDLIDAEKDLKSEISFYSKALSLEFAITKKTYSNTPDLENWIQEQVSKWNTTLRNFKCNDQIRLEKITIIEDIDRFYDTLRVSTDLIYAPSFFELQRKEGYTDLSLLHELFHQRGIHDIYEYTVYDHRENGSTVNILDPDGNRAAGTDRLPYYDPYNTGALILYHKSDNFLMGTGSRFLRETSISPVTAFGLNLVHGYRTPFVNNDSLRNSNLLVNMGNHYLTFIPERIKLKFIDENDQLINTSKIEIFVDLGDVPYLDIYSEEPQVIINTSSDGYSYFNSSDLRFENRLLPDVLIIRVFSDSETKWGYCFLPIYDLNEAYLNKEKQFEKELYVNLL